MGTGDKLNKVLSGFMGAAIAIGVGAQILSMMNAKTYGSWRTQFKSKSNFFLVCEKCGGIEWIENGRTSNIQFENRINYLNQYGKIQYKNKNIPFEDDFICKNEICEHHLSKKKYCFFERCGFKRKTENSYYESN